MTEHLIVTLDLLNSGYKPEFLEIVNIIALLFGVSVIVIKNPISSLMSLIGLFTTVAVYLILIGLNFIGFSYLIVYVGAVSILFLFILMLINIRKSELLSNNVNSVPLALLIIILLDHSWVEVSPEYNGIINNSDTTNNLVNLNLFGEIIHIWKSIFTSMDNNLANIMFIAGNCWDGFIVGTSHIATVGMVLYTSYSIWLLMASLILLLAMVGSIVITIK